MSLSHASLSSCEQRELRTEVDEELEDDDDGVAHIRPRSSSAARAGELSARRSRAEDDASPGGMMRLKEKRKERERKKEREREREREQRSPLALFGFSTRF